MFAIAMILLQVTDCTTVGNQTRCTSQPGIQQPVGPIDYGSRQTQIDGAAMSNLGSALADRKARRARKRIGKLIAAGQCDEARSQALEAGDFDLARQAQSLCR